MNLRLVFENLRRPRTQGRLVQGREPILLDSLLSPLRYDILIRADYFRFYADNRDLFWTDFARYVSKARDHPYFVWFTQIFCHRIQPSLLRNQEELMRAFSTRVLKSARLYESFTSIGPNVRYAIKLKSGKTILPTRKGKKMAARYHAGNGCHRLALFLLAGYRYLPSKYYQVKYYPSFQPIDNTVRLVGPLAIGPEDYFRFLSRGYADRPYARKNSLLRHVKQTNPERLAELEGVIAIDEQQLKARP